MCLKEIQFLSQSTVIALLDAVEVDQHADAARPFRMPVQWVNRPNLDFRGFSGLISTGSVKPGDTLRSLRENRAILFSTHIIGDVEAISDRVLIIHQGRLLGDGRVQDLAERACIPGAGLEEVFAHLVRTTAPTHV